MKVDNSRFWKFQSQKWRKITEVVSSFFRFLFSVSRAFPFELLKMIKFNSFPTREHVRCISILFASYASAGRILILFISVIQRRKIKSIWKSLKHVCVCVCARVGCCHFEQSETIFYLATRISLKWQTWTQKADCQSEALMSWLHFTTATPLIRFWIFIYRKTRKLSWISSSVFAFLPGKWKQKDIKIWRDSCICRIHFVFCCRTVRRTDEKLTGNLTKWHLMRANSVEPKVEMKRKTMVWNCTSNSERWVQCSEKKMEITWNWHASEMTNIRR